MNRMKTGASLLALFLALTPLAAEAAPPPPSPTPAPMQTTSPPPPAMAPMDNHVDGEIAFLKAELKITDSQEKAWNNFAKAVHEGNKELIDARSAPASIKMVDMLDNQAKVLKARLDVVEKLKTALDPLYKDLDDSQKVAADQMIPMHLGMLIM